MNFIAALIVAFVGGALTDDAMKIGWDAGAFAIAAMTFSLCAMLLFN